MSRTPCSSLLAEGAHARCCRRTGACAEFFTPAYAYVTAYQTDTIVAYRHSQRLPPPTTSRRIAPRYRFAAAAQPPRRAVPEIRTRRGRHAASTRNCRRLPAGTAAAPAAFRGMRQGRCSSHVSRHRTLRCRSHASPASRPFFVAATQAPVTERPTM